MNRALPLLLCICTTTARADAPADLGTSVSVQVEANGDTTVDVRHGELKVKAGGKETRVHAGETVRAQKGKPLKRLLPSPTLLAPADGATVATPDLVFSWQKVPSATRYIFEVSAAPELSAAQTQTVDGTRATVHLEPGSWYWRVTALDGEGTPGKRHPARRLTIDTTPPTLKTGKPQWR